MEQIKVKPIREVDWSFISDVNNNDWETAVIVFKQGPWFRAEFTEHERSYLTWKDNKAFKPGMIGYSIFANCLDGNDAGVRLDWYMRGNGDLNWQIEKIYLCEVLENE